MIKGIVNQLETLVLVSSPTGFLETEWSLHRLVSHLLTLTYEVLSVSFDALNQIHSVIETGDGESWLCHHHRLMEPTLITALKRLGLC